VLEAKRGDLADLARQPPLAGSEPWGSDEQNEGAVHQP
jgi:hypothetical protein